MTTRSYRCWFINTICLYLHLSKAIVGLLCIIINQYCLEPLGVTAGLSVSFSSALCFVTPVKSVCSSAAGTDDGSSHGTQTSVQVPSLIFSHIFPHLHLTVQFKGCSTLFHQHLFPRQTKPLLHQWRIRFIFIYFTFDVFYFCAWGVHPAGHSHTSHDSWYMYLWFTALHLQLFI